MNTTRKSWMLLLAWVLSAGGLSAADWHVDAALPVPGQGASWSTALNEIQSAIDAAVPGDTVRVAPGTYRGTVVLKEGVNLVGAGAQTTQIVGGTVCCVVRGASRCRIEGFTILGDGEDDVDGIYAEGTHDFQVVRNHIQGHSWSGIAGIRASVRVVGNVILSNRVAGVLLDGPSLEPSRIEHNTICGNANEAGVTIWREAAGIVVNNIITGNTGSGGVFCVEGGRVELRRNNVFANSCQVGPPRNYVGCRAGDGDLSADPAFANPSQGDYRLRRSSPCIDAAIEPALDDPPLLALDLFGAVRCADGNGNGSAAPDLGALETEPLRLTIAVQPEPGLARLAWNSLPGESYRVLAGPSLVSGPWHQTAEMVSTGNFTTWSLPLQPGASQWYQVAVDPLY